MKMRNKGKVHPFTTTSSPSSSSSSSPANKDNLSILNLLPATLLTLLVVLTDNDREVLAYMITRSLNNTSSSSSSSSSSSYLNIRKTSSHSSLGAHHKSSFDCDCFHCYTSFWYRWDSSPNRELIQQAIETFEDHLNNKEGSSKNNKKMGRKKKNEKATPQVKKSIPVVVVVEEEEEKSIVDDVAEVRKEVDDVAVVVRGGGEGYKGFARTVLPDVMGIFNSRLWKLWSPNV